MSSDESNHGDISVTTPPHTTPTTPLTALIKELCVSSTTIRSDLCSILSKTDFSDITALEMNSSKKVKKTVLAENIITLTNIIEQINESLNPVFNSENLSEALDNIICDTNINNQLHSDLDTDIVTSTGIRNAVDKAIKKHSKDIETKLGELHTIVSNLYKPQSTLSSSETLAEHKSYIAPDGSNEPVSHNLKYIDTATDNYITSDTSTALKDFLSKEKFKIEGNRGVVKYGDAYNYMGNKSKPNPLPPCIKIVMDKINEEFSGGKYELNSCLVNKFQGPEASLPSHSDNEYDIDPDSDIFTITIGDPMNIVFRNIMSGEEIVQTPQPNSLYIMSRNSQNFYQHRIDSDASFTGERYSITFRCVHWRFLNSTCIIGDSNTSKIEFGCDRKQVGKSTPGKQEFAAIVEDIDAKCCASYSNVVLMVGTNNLKKNNVSVADVKAIYSKYKGKILEIKKLNKRCKIFVVPVLPTKLVTVNRKIIIFNNFILDDLRQSIDSVSIVGGSARFLDRATGLLSESLSKYHNDPLHINSAGVGMLVKFIKEAIFQRKKGRKTHSNKDGSPTVSRRQSIR